MTGLTFIGATREVTGSCHLLEVNDTKILLDCGMRQGGGVSKAPEFPFKPDEINAVILSHAHIDHSGLLPLLVSQKFKGKIYSTVATRELTRILLYDSAKIQEEDYVAGGEPPLYTEEDVNETMRLFEVFPYHEEFNIPDVGTVKFYDAGHILGSAITVISTAKTVISTAKTVCYTGDLGHGMSPILRAPETPDEEIDYLIMESTYGNKLHSKDDPTLKIKEIVPELYKNKGKLLIPVFAVGRAQEILYSIKQMKERGEIPPDFKVYLDSPMADKSTSLYSNMADYLKHEFYRQFLNNTSPFEFEGLKIIKGHEESLNLATSNGPAIILAASGMLEGGRVMNHLPKILSDKNSAVCFVGYQVEGTLGRAILDGVLDGVSEVKLKEKLVEVLCRIEVISSYSAHADKKGLFNFVNSLKVNPYKVFVVHGEKKANNAVVESLKNLKLRAVAPVRGDSESFGGTVIKTIKEKEVEIDFSPEYIVFGKSQLRIAPFCGALVESKTGVVRLVSNSGFIGLIEAEEQAFIKGFKEKKIYLENLQKPDDNLSEKDPSEKIPVMSYEEYCKKLEEFYKTKDNYGDSILTRNLAHELYCIVSREGKDSVIRLINKKKGQGKFNIADEETINEFVEFVKIAVKNLTIREFCKGLDFYKSKKEC